MDPGELGNGPSGDRNVEAEFSDNVYATGYNDAGYDEYVAVGESGYEGYPTEQRYGYAQHRADAGDNRGGGRREKEPSASVMIRGLKPTTSAEMITDTLKAFGAVNGVRLIRNKQTGEPRGFAFVDFHLVEDAVNLMAYQNKSLFIDGRTVQLEYSTTHTPPLSSSGGSGGSFKDWICPQCNATNFARRTSCYLCNLAKPANPTLAPQPEDAPSSSLIVKGLAATSTDESIRSVLSAYSQVKDVRLVRDKTSGLSRCFAFVEFFTVEEATYVLGSAANSFIDGSAIRLSYARQMDGGARHHSSHGHHSTASEQAAWMAYNQQYANNNTNQQSQSWPTPPGGDGYVYDATSGLYFNASTGYYYEESTKCYMYFDEPSQQYMCYDQTSNSYLPYVPTPAPPPTPTLSSSIPTSTPTTTTSEHPITQPNPTKPKPIISAQPTTVVKSAEPVISPRIATPFASDQTPIPPPNVITAVATPTGPVKMILKEAKPKKALSSSNVPGIFAKKKISQEVARWNQKGKELNEEPLPPPVTSSANATPITLKHPSSPHIPSSTHTATIPTEPPTTSLSSPVPSTAPSPSPVPSPASAPLTDQEPKAICLLCKRQFKTLELLHKHEALSDLHKTNLELARQKQLQAKEAEYPHEETPQKRSREDHGDTNWNTDYDWEKSGNKTRRTESPGGALGASNLGYQMMKNAGWQGGGLGKTGDGMIAPIEVTMRSERAGLGADDDEKYAVTPGDSYKQATRKKALSRFEAITNINVAEVNANHPFLKKQG